MKNSFIAWIGGKRLLRKTIIALMPEHKTYVEVFGGGGWVLFGKQPSAIEVYNDLNTNLVTLYRVVRAMLPLFIKRLEALLASRDEYNTFQQALKTGDFESDIDRAIAFYYCIKNSFGSGITTGWAFSPTQPPRKCVTEDLELAHERLKNVYIDNLSFDRLIPNWDRAETLFYCDPPYYMLLDLGGRDYYQCSFTREDHARLRDTLSGIKGKFILSYDDHPDVRKLYEGFNLTEVAGGVRYTMNNRPGCQSRVKPELIIMNFEPSEQEMEPQLPWG